MLLWFFLLLVHDQSPNLQAVVPETASALSPKKPGEAKEETNDSSLDKHMVISLTCRIILCSHANNKYWRPHEFFPII